MTLSLWIIHDRSPRKAAHSIAQVLVQWPDGCRQARAKTPEWIYDCSRKGPPKHWPTPEAKAITRNVDIAQRGETSAMVSQARSSAFPSDVRL